MSDDGAPGRSPARPRTVPPELLAGWRSAEERLYPVVMVRPDLYQSVVRMVGQVADELRRSCPDVGSLVEAAPHVVDAIQRMASRDGQSLAEVDVPMVAAAACCFRYRELAAEAARDQRVADIAAAVARGGVWVVVEQTGEPQTFSAIPFTKVEMHVPSGRALEQSVEQDERTGGARFRLAEVAVNRETGQRIDADSRGPGAEDFDDIDRWVLAIRQRRRAIEEDSGTY
jgi:hypothetical protein